MAGSNDLNRLLDLSLALGSSLSLDTETQTFLQWLREALDPALAVLFIIQENRKGMRVVGSLGHDFPVDQILPLGLDPWAWLGRQGALIPPAGDPRRYALPLHLEGQLLGMLCIVSNKDQSKLLEEQRLAKLAAAYLAPIIRNIQRFQAVEREVAQHKAKLEETHEQLIQQERLAAIGQLAAGIAHDFNNLLGVIVLHSEMALGEPSISTKTRERIRIIFDQAQRGAALTQQILDFSRKATIQPHPLDLSALLQETVTLLRRTLPENIRVDLHLPEEPCLVNADPSRLQQALFNLAANARDAMPNGGTLAFKLSHMHVRSDTKTSSGGPGPGHWILIRVSDTGPGIAADIVPRIFEPFFTTKEPGKGTGLGLSQVYGIIKQHGGHISVQSQPGQGATFNLCLPALELATQPGIVDANYTSFLGRGEVVLVVEDDDHYRLAVCEILEKLNYRALEASNGRAALEFIRKHPQEVDLVLSDVVMPEMDGLDLSRLLRQRFPHIRILLMSGYPLPAEQRRGPLQEVGWIQKPLQIQKLSYAIRKALDRETHSRPLPQ